MQFENEFKNIDAQASGLLGDYDSSGTYLIDAKILDELKKALKIITSYTEWQILAFASVDEYKFNFEITVEEGEQNLKRATLYLLEKANIGYIDKPIKSKVAEEILINDNSFFENIKKAFNLVIAEESEVKDINNKTLINIINKKKDKKSKYISLIEPSMNLDKDYVALMLELLSKNKNCKNVILQFKSELQQKKLSKLDKAYFRNVRIILDKVINASYDKFDENLINKIEKLRTQFFKEFSQISPSKSQNSNKGSNKKKNNKKKGKGKDNTQKYSNSSSNSASSSFKSFSFSYSWQGNSFGGRIKEGKIVGKDKHKPAESEDRFFTHNSLRYSSIKKYTPVVEVVKSDKIEVKSPISLGEDVSL